MSGMLSDLIPSYVGCGFQVVIPTLTIFEERVEVKSRLRRSEDSLDSIIVDYCLFAGKNNVCFTTRPEDMLLPPSGIGNSFTLTVNVAKKQFVYSDAQVTIGFLTQSGLRVEATFISDFNGKLSFRGVRKGKMDSEDEVRFINVIKACNKKKTPLTPSDSKPIPTTSQPTQISDFVKALAEERNHLKYNGGRSYKATNGKRITVSGGTYSYVFDLETELYLSDDAPIKINAAGRSTTGSVLLCDGFKITVILDGDLGARIGVAHITVEPWRLLDAMSERLSNISLSDRIAMMLMNQGPTLSSNKPLSAILTGQEAAKLHALNEPITIIWGPPGTGKTHTMAEIAINSLTQGKRVLVVSHSNISVDGVVLKVAELLRSRGIQQYLIDGKVLRYGYVRDETLSHDQQATSFNYALNRSPSLRLKMEELNKKRDQLKGTQYSEEHIRIEQETKRIRSLLHDEEQRYVSKARLVATTASKIYADKLFTDEEYDVVMFDEISMAYVPQILCAATFAKQHLICVGDFRQLAPISQSKAKSILEKDLFSYLGIADQDGHIFHHPWLILLDQQRRMHPSISAFPSKTFYHGLLKDHSSVLSSRDNIAREQPFRGHPLSLIDLTGTYCAAGKNNDNSRYNLLSAIVTFAAALSAETNGENSVGIITPYAAQTRLIRALIQDYRKNQKTEIACSTVHQFQGSERNIICFDAVESYPSKKLGILMSKNENNSVTRLINVAITRARGKLILVANRGFWLKKFDGTSNALYLLVRHLLQHGNLVDHKSGQLKRFISTVNVGKNISLYARPDTCLAPILESIEKAKAKVLVSLPDSKLIPASANPIWEAITKARNRGVLVEIKAKETSMLPQNWKSSALLSANAIFPLILIDDHTIWYGYPITSCFFSDGQNGGYATVQPIVAKIKGENTIEMIKSLTDIEHGGNEILEDDTAGKPAAGFRRFVEEKEFCPLCKQPFKLARGQSGKHYLRCSNSKCKNSKPLDPKLVTWYLDQKRIRCPKHKCDLTVRSGSFGVYVHCEHNHNYNLSEI